eukprot:gene4397-6669_t
MDRNEHPLDKPLSRIPREVNLSTFALLFAEIVRYSINRIQSVPELEQKLSILGKRVGIRVVELISLRERATRRKLKIHDALTYLQTNLWRTLFGKTADLLEQSAANPSKFMISDQDILVNQFISLTSDHGDLNCAAFIGGILEAALEGMGFSAQVEAHTVHGKGTTLVIEFNLDLVPAEVL